MTFSILLHARQEADLKALLGNSDATFEGYVLYKDELHELLSLAHAKKKTLIPFSPSVYAPYRLTAVFDSFAPLKLTSNFMLSGFSLDILYLRNDKKKLTKVAYAIMYETELNKFKHSEIIKPASVLDWLQNVPYLVTALIDLLGIKLFARFAKPEGLLYLLEHQE